MLKSFLLLAILSFIYSCADSRPAKDNAKVNRAAFSNLSQQAQGFGEHVYPILQQNCVGCHASTVAPLMVQQDIELAAEEVLNNNKVDFNNIGTSRLVKRLSVDQHNCGTKCDILAEEMIFAISQWRETIPESFLKKEGIYTVTKNIRNGLPTEQSITVDDVDIIGKVVSFDLSAYLDGNDVKLELDIYPIPDPKGDLYNIKNIRIVTLEPNYNFVIRHVEISINGKLANNGIQGYKNIKALVRSYDQNTHDLEVANLEALLLQDKGINSDQVGLFIKKLAEY
jgi:hypothetical protein